jgi:hypothetical protein
MDAEGTRLLLSLVPNGEEKSWSISESNKLRAGGVDQSERLGVEQETLGGSSSVSVIQYDGSFLPGIVSVPLLFLYALIFRPRKTTTIIRIRVKQRKNPVEPISP